MISGLLWCWEESNSIFYGFLEFTNYHRNNYFSIFYTFSWLFEFSTVYLRKLKKWDGKWDGKSIVFYTKNNKKYIDEDPILSQEK